MANTNLTSREKWHVYHTLAQINRAFRILHFHLRNLEQTKPFHSQRLREYQGISRELQFQVNTELLEDLVLLERDDSFRFGKVKSAREQHLKGQ